jgi:F-type H+-transporting ATPase subunit b
MNIIPDLYLVLVQILPFLVVIVGLKVILFDPMLAFVLERDVATRGVRHDAEALLATAEKMVGQYEAAIEKTRVEITELRTQRRAEANAEYQRLVTAARQATDARVAEAMKQLGEVAADARNGLAAESDGLAHDIAQQALGRKLEG